MNPLQPIEPLDPFVLTAASPRYPLPAGGEFVHCLSADEDFLLAVNRGSGAIPLSSNRFFRMPPGSRFEFIEARRKAGAVVASNNIVLIVGSGDYRDGSTVITQPVPIEVPASLVDLADQLIPASTATQILPALSSRREALVSNPSSVNFRIGGANTVGFSRGVLVPPGATFVLTVKGELWAYQSSGVAQSIAANYIA